MESIVWTGTKDCGCLVAISLDEKETRDWTNYKIRLMSLGKAKKLLKYCKHK